MCTQVDAMIGQWVKFCTCYNHWPLPDRRYQSAPCFPDHSHCRQLNDDTVRNWERVSSHYWSDSAGSLQRAWINRMGKYYHSSHLTMSILRVVLNQGTTRSVSLRRPGSLLLIACIKMNNIQHSIPVLNGKVQRHFISIMSIMSTTHKTEIKKAEWLWSV